MSGPTREEIEPITRTLLAVATGAIGAGLSTSTVLWALISVVSMIAGQARGLSAARQVDMADAMMRALMACDPDVATSPGGDA